jgi:hypothetical protein
MEIGCKGGELRRPSRVNKMPITVLNATVYKRSQDSSAGITMGYDLGLPGLGFRQRQEIFFLLHSVQTGSGAHPSLLSNGYRGLFP